MAPTIKQQAEDLLAESLKKRQLEFISQRIIRKEYLENDMAEIDKSIKEIGSAQRHSDLDRFDPNKTAGCVIRSGY